MSQRDLRAKARAEKREQKTDTRMQTPSAEAQALKSKWEQAEEAHRAAKEKLSEKPSEQEVAAVEKLELESFRLQRQWMQSLVVPPSPSSSPPPSLPNFPSLSSPTEQPVSADEEDDESSSSVEEEKRDLKQLRQEKAARLAEEREARRTRLHAAKPWNGMEFGKPEDNKSNKLISPLEKFSGNEDVDTWLRSFTIAVTANKLTEDGAKALFATSMSGNAQRWYMGALMSNAYSLKHKMKKLRECFGEPDELRTQKYTAAARERKQEPSEKVAVYASVLEDLCNRAGLTEEEMVHLFVRGVREDIGFFLALQAKHCKTFGQVYQRALQIESASSLVQRTRSSSSSSSSSRPAQAAGRDVVAAVEPTRPYQQQQHQQRPSQQTQRPTQSQPQPPRAQQTQYTSAPHQSSMPPQNSSQQRVGPSQPFNRPRRCMLCSDTSHPTFRCPVRAFLLNLASGRTTLPPGATTTTPTQSQSTQSQNTQPHSAQSQSAQAQAKGDQRPASLNGSARS